MNEIRNNFKPVSVHTFLSGYFVTSVNEISKDFQRSFTQKSYHGWTSEISSWVLLLSHKIVNIVSQTTSLLSLPESESLKIDVKLKLSDSFYVCFVSLFLYASHCGFWILKFQSLHHKVSTLYLWFPSNSSTVGPTTFTCRKWVKFSSLCRFHQLNFNSRIWLKKLSSVALE